ncbi:M10 family metallopeptidase C-terminal domain-containing protein [Cognatishimia sp. F0-27]|uniref:M10 family metallopeptidase C-terminal domain-containing protein n=1 Tax=Cognatishimia sp. F0-27 TaxID=2816855 RepID=UPI001D0C8341|nr:M10 family metallopeptidase C-terminal domain-containing protein [Cognatishimia sp. F0-27]MCC1493217.1 M10 family metallopeptidase C-terminal domain-containing protein [Cognatishimia sp. F0-27]
MVNIYVPNAHDTISPDELKLYHLIMEYRATANLPVIPLSAGLSATAGRHAVDTYENIWVAGLQLPEGANLHSFSDAPYYSDHSAAEVMWFAPQRLNTSYPDYGFEISAAGSRTVEGALAGWQGSSGHDNVIMNRSIWSDWTWEAIGIGVEINQDYSVPYQGNIHHVWFGRSPDPGGAPLIEGTDEADEMKGTQFDDTIGAGGGDDRVTGENGHDEIDGGSGRDTIHGGEGNDTLAGGSNFDTVLYTGIFAPVALNLEAGRATGGGGTDRLSEIEHAIGGASHDTIYGTKTHGNRIEGSAGEDTLYGLSGRDTLLGGDSDDRLYGGSDGDQLFGGAQNDFLDGGPGRDLLTGGPGADNFVLRSISDTAVGQYVRDEIRDFSAAEGDRINLFLVDADVTQAGDQAFTEVERFTGEAGELVLQSLVRSGRDVTLASMDVDGDGRADGQLYIVGTASVDDFIL